MRAHLKRNKTLLQHNLHPTFYSCNCHTTFNLFRVQSPFLSFFSIERASWVRTLRTRGL